MAGESIQLKIAQNELDRRRAGVAVHGIGVNKAGLTRRGGRGALILGQEVDNLGCQVQGVDQLVLGAARVDRDASHLDDRFVGGEGFVDQLAHFAAVKRIGKISLQQRQIDVADARANLLIRCKTDTHFAVRQFRVGQQMGGHRHDDRHAGFVVATKHGVTTGGDNVMADLLAQIWVDRWGQ